MWTHRIPPDECVRACEWVSLRLDSQLSDFESVLLDAHTARCPDCRAFADNLTGLTETLRGIQPEEASFAIQLPRRRAVRVTALRVVSATAAVAVVGLSGIVGLEVSARRATPVAVKFDSAVLGLKERQLAHLDNPGQDATQPVRRGVAAAEQVTVGTLAGSTHRELHGTTKRLPENA
jgi:hypothetical protein